MRIERAFDIEKAAALLAGGARPVSGGTVVMIAEKFSDADTLYADLTGIKELKEIRLTAEGLSIGSQVTCAETEKWLDAHPEEAAFGALYTAVSSMGSPQIRNKATIAGGICDASPASDFAPALLVLGARIRLYSTSGMREIAISDFFTGYRQTAVRNDELVTEIIIPNNEGTSFYERVGLRGAVAVSVAGVAGYSGREGVRLAASSLAEKPVRLAFVEALTSEKTIGRIALRQALDSDISPVDDLRATAKYRREVAENLLIKALEGYGYDIR